MVRTGRNVPTTWWLCHCIALLRYSAVFRNWTSAYYIAFTSSIFSLLPPQLLYFTIITIFCCTPILKMHCWIFLLQISNTDDIIIQISILTAAKTKFYNTSRGLKYTTIKKLEDSLWNWNLFTYKIDWVPIKSRNQMPGMTCWVTERWISRLK